MKNKIRMGDNYDASKFESVPVATPEQIAAQNQAMQLDGPALIAAERYRQISAEGYDAKHDAEHDDGQLTDAALCYGAVASAEVRGSSAKEWPVEAFDDYNDSLLNWPWAHVWWKPSDDPVRNLVKAGALIAAEIDRILLVRKNPPIIGSGKRMV